MTEVTARAPAEASQGLTEAEVAERVAGGLTNRADERASRTTGEILRANLLTRFNLILGILLVVILAAGEPQDGLFGVVLVSNALIGILQELRAKRTLDRLAVLHAPHARVVRDGGVQEVAIECVVLDDLVELRTGDQVVADGVVRAASGLQVDESLLTGEADPVDKGVGADVLSGSFVVAGTGRFQATAVGPAAYARMLAAEARQFSLVRSDLVEGINRILRYVTWALPPLAVLLVFSQLHADISWRGAVSGAVGGLVGMVPQGLVLLTSIAFAVAAVTLARRGVLVQELPGVEGLARVDVVCFDKTGTLTDGTFTLAGIEPLTEGVPIEAALGALADVDDRNATVEAVASAFPAPAGWRRTGDVPFSSARKWSAAAFDGRGCWVLGAPEIVADETALVGTAMPAGAPAEVVGEPSARAGAGPGVEEVLARAGELAAAGRRVLLLSHTEAPLAGQALPQGLRAVALVVLEERLRPDARETLDYFARQGVAVKVISGDSPRTLAAVAADAGMTGAGEPVDARALEGDDDRLGRAVEEHSLFGRVTPAQKQGMVRALQRRGHTVAMTGDGVNDVLALKLADIGIAMGSGAAATRSVAQLVLLDGRFSTLPGVVAEGRRVTANIERVANLFITKTVWAALLAVVIGLARWPYPFLPRHLTIIDTLTIGIPAFVIALGPNLRRYVPGFVDRVLRFTLPVGALVAVAAFAAYAVARAQSLPLVEQRTAATIVTMALGLGVLVLLALPLSSGRGLLVAAAIGSFALLFPLERVRTFYALQLPTAVLGWVALIAAAGLVALVAGWVAARRARATPGTPPGAGGVRGGAASGSPWPRSGGCARG